MRNQNPRNPLKDLSSNSMGLPSRQEEDQNCGIERDAVNIMRYEKWIKATWDGQCT